MPAAARSAVSDRCCRAARDAPGTYCVRSARDPARAKERSAVRPHRQREKEGRDRPPSGVHRPPRAHLHFGQVAEVNVLSDMT